MDPQAKPIEPASGTVPASRGLLRRWLGNSAPVSSAPDSSEMDVGYESALPWFTDSECGSESTAAGEL